MREVNQNESAVFFGVMKGKMSEGLDLPDKYVRLVIVIGIPLANLGSQETLLKINTCYYKSQTGKTKLDGEKWYKLEAMRAIN